MKLSDIIFSDWSEKCKVPIGTKFNMKCAKNNFMTMKI